MLSKFRKHLSKLSKGLLEIPRWWWHSFRLSIALWVSIGFAAGLSYLFLGWMDSLGFKSDILYSATIGVISGFTVIALSQPKLFGYKRKIE